MNPCLDGILDQLIEDCRKEAWSEAARHLYDHLSRRCPLLYGVDDPQPWEYDFDEEKLNRELLGPIASMYLLEPVIPETSEDEVSLQRLAEQIGMKTTNRKPGQICGRMFKSGDPTYTCKECALDDTCVLCHDCFHKSAHAKHKYKMHSSYGGGYCDCGDPEAWSKDYACQMHTAEKQPGDDELNFDMDVPEDMKKRILNVTAILLKYAVTLICWQGTQDLPDFLSECTLPENWQKYKTMLFNDETHTYDAVISALETATGCTNQQAMFLATIVDREGRSIVLSNTEGICSRAKEQIQHRTRRDVNRRTEKSGPLEVKIMTHGLVAHQTFAVKILQWLTTQAQQYSVIASIIGDVLMNECATICRYDELKAAIPPPKPPRSLSSLDDRPKPDGQIQNVGNNQFERLMDIAEEPQLIIRAPNVNEADIVINPLMILNEGLMRQRHLSTNQNPQARPPKLEKKFIKNVNNCLSCGHLTTAVQLSLFDRRLWKAARSSFHQLLMCTVLMDLDYKMKFGAFIIKNYEFIYQDYIDDDHEYDVSILSLCVQVFTVSSVAAYLIEKENGLAVIFETLRHHCQQYLRPLEHNERFFRLDFSSSSLPAILRRSLSMFKDAMYLLQAAPINWTEGMMEAFINGFEMYIGFAINMQGMDSIRRQCEQHQLIEAEWETGFNIFVMMQETTTLFINWSKSNAYVHQRIMKIVMDNLHSIAMCMPEFQNFSNVEIDEYGCEVVVFSVGRDYVSVHQPIWRLAAGLLLADWSVLRYYEFGNKDKKPNWINIDYPIEKLMEYEWKKKEPIEKLYIWPMYMLLEIPMRVLVLNAQFNAQLWKRNGFSLVNQMHNYTAPFCRQEMFDRDFQLIQICAAKMNSNEFLVRFLDRFNLNKWASKNFDGLPLKLSTEGTPSTPSLTPEELSRIVVFLAEEFLHYLIAILGERYFPGVGKCTREDSLKRDIIHLLCTGPKTFSAIEKAIVIESPMKSIKREEILNIVADFSRPNTTSAGVFKLKDKYREEYNAFYIRYSKPQLSQAEQTQWKEREKEIADIQACPPPKPIEFESFFGSISKIFECELFIQILLLILARFEKHSRYSSDGLLHRCLFLIGMGLNEQELMHKKMKEFKFLEKAENSNIFGMLKNLEGKIKIHHQLLGWVLKRHEYVKSLLIEDEEPADVENKSKMEIKNLNLGDQSAKRSAIGKARSQKALKMMNKLQKKFINANIEFPMEDSNNSIGFAVEEDEYGKLVDSSSFPICLGPNKSNVVSPNNFSVTCILCQEMDYPTFNGKIMVCSAFVQNSKIFTQDGPTVTRNFEDPMEVFTPANMPIGYNVSTCSHVMHAECFKEFSENLWNRDRTRQRVQVVGQQIVDQEHHEYLCPLCKRLSNAALPYLPTLDCLNFVHKASKTRPNNIEIFEIWLKNLTDASIKLNKQNEKCGKSGHKTHSRKRSHSERSLMELQKQRDDNMSNSYFGSQSFVTPLSPASDTGLTDTSSNTGNLTHDQRGTSEPVEGRNDIEMNDEMAMLNAAEKTAENSLQNLFLSKLKNIVSPKSRDNIPQSLTDLTPIIRNFLGYVSKVGPDMNSMFPKEQIEVFRLFKTTAFVLRSTTNILKSEGKPLFGAFNTRQRDCITCLSRLAAIGSLQLKNSTIQLSIARGLTPFLIPLKDQKHSFTVPQSGIPDFMSIFANIPLRNVFHHDNPDNSPSGSRTRLSEQNFVNAESHINIHREMNILDCDMLSLAIQLSMTIGFIWNDGEFLFLGQKQHELPLYKIPDGSVDELYVVYLTLLGQIFQTIASYQFSINNDMNCEFTNIQRERIKKLMKPLIDIDPGYGYINVDLLLVTIKKSIISFLEPLAVFYNAITLVPPPDVLKHPDYNEFEALCRYMGLPTHLEDILAGDFVERLFAQWSHHIVPVKDELSKLVRQPIVPRELIKLPHEFTDLLRMCTKYKCPSMKVSGDHHGSNQPTMCLVCGTLMCSQAYCCQKTFNDESMGACNYHMRICSGENNGIFLRIRECQVLLLSRKRGTYKSAPYVDEFGETDSGFRRGNPLHLQPEIYKKLQRLWNYQEVAEEVVNQYDMNHRNMNFDWHHF